ncbi:protein kinase [bacterium]|nr:protein kinase [bacterium]
MLGDARVDQIVAQWEELLGQGQYVPPEELCADCPELLREVQQRIDAADPQLAEETAAADDIGVMMTVVEEGRSDSGESGALRLVQQYRKLRFHAKGGLGEIYIADDRELQRDVVLKFIKTRHRNRKECREQFRTEAEVTARLDHPGVVPVYGFGQTKDGRLCYAMRFIQGESLEDRIARLHAPMAAHKRHHGGGSPFSPGRTVEFRGLLNRFVTVCRTIAYANNRGILHRDIKPDNIMLGKYGDTLVVDWGLAMAIDRDETARASGEQTLMPSSGSESSSTGSTGGPVGTPAYMSPEQATGVFNLTPASDIFALGATLYKLLTGTAPYKGESAHESIAFARCGTFTLPRDRNSDIPRGLEAICLKAMSFDPGARYATALDLADDLERWLADEPLDAAADTRLQSIGRWFRHHRGWTLSLVSSLMVVSLVVSAAAVTQQRAADRERDARIAASEAHVDSLQLSAQFVARTVGRDLQLRWLLLQNAAADPGLADILLRMSQQKKIPSDGDLELQYWLADHRTAAMDDGGPARSTSWFVDLPDGRMAGRNPPSNRIGINFGYRDYFHGLGYDLDENDAQANPRPPITAAYRSIVFRSTSTDRWMVVLTVPVWASIPADASAADSEGPKRQVVGVLGMSQSLGDFEILNTRLQGDRAILLVDTGENSDGQRGTILHDSRAADPNWMTRHAALAEEARRVPQEVLDDLIELRAVRRLQHEQTANAQPLTGSDAIRRSHHDYLSGDDNWIAACEPIIFHRARDTGRGGAVPAKIEDTGWIVVVQEPKLP